MIDTIQLDPRVQDAFTNVRTAASNRWQVEDQYEDEPQMADGRSPLAIVPEYWTAVAAEQAAERELIQAVLDAARRAQRAPRSA